MYLIWTTHTNSVPHHHPAAIEDPTVRHSCISCRAITSTIFLILRFVRLQPPLYLMHLPGPVRPQPHPHAHRGAVDKRKCQAIPQSMQSHITPESKPDSERNTCVVPQSEA